MDEGNVIPIINMRTFFNREIFMYALGDIRLKKPIALKQAMYVIAFLAIWSGPIIYVFGLVLNPYFIIITFVPPFLLGAFANRPIWGGRTLMDFIKVTFNYIQEPRGWTEHRANSELGKAVYHVEHDIWVSRRKELNILADMKEAQKRGIRV